MKGVECKLPIQEDHRFFLEKSVPYPGTKKVAVIAAVLLLVAMVLMVVFTFQSINGINELRQEIDDLKVSIKALQKKIDDCSNNDPENVTMSVEDGDDNNGDDDDSSYEYYDYDYSEPANVAYDDDNTLLKTGEAYTKDAKIPVPSTRLKRNIIDYNQDESHAKSESAEARRRNNTFKRNYQNFQYSTPTILLSSNLHPPEQRTHQKTEQTSPSPRLIHSRRIHVKQNNNMNRVRHPVKASALKSGDSYNGEGNPDAEFTVVTEGHLGGTRHRQRRLELDEPHVRTGRMRPLPTAHFSGDTSKYVLGQHDNFNGNGHLRHPQRTFVDWSESSWFHSLGMDRHFSLTDGILTIKESGLYFIYAQIYYYDEHDINGFRVYRNENETLLQCTTMTHSAERVMKGNTCFTAAAEYLNENDRISVGDLSESRYSLFEPGKSFFGVIKLGDVKIK